jgi:hypothetical protein
MPSTGRLRDRRLMKGDVLVTAQQSLGLKSGWPATETLDLFRLRSTAAMNFPVKHHFSPAFSLQPWTGSDGLLFEIRRINGRVAASRKHPNVLREEPLSDRGRTGGSRAASRSDFHEAVRHCRRSGSLKKIMSGDKRHRDCLRDDARRREFPAWLVVQ